MAGPHRGRSRALALGLLVPLACTSDTVALVTGGDSGTDGDGSTGDPIDDTGPGVPVCGDGEVEVGEQCDGVNLGGKTCELFGYDAGEGGLACDPDCRLDFSGCVYCGNGVIDPGEACDGDDLGGATCESVGRFTPGRLLCTPGCELDTSACPTACGNGVIDADEECDAPGLVACTELYGPEYNGSAYCAECVLLDVNCSICGDGEAAGDEVCDGSPVAPNGVPLSCSGLLGFPSTGQPTCNPDCTADTSDCSECGNGSIDADEQCDGAALAGMTCADFGFGVGSLVCSDDCTFDPSGCTNCGNGTIDAGEACDGMDLGGLGCVDLGFPDGTLGCLSDCTHDLAQCGSCGDGIAVPGEACDGADLGGSVCADALPGAQAGTPTCTPACTLDPTGCVLITPGAVVITEILYASLAFPLTNTGQWFELHNPDPAITWDLQGCEVESGAPVETFTIDAPLPIPPGGDVGLGTGTELDLGFVPAFPLAPGYGLSNFGDTVRLECGGIVVDQVVYDDMMPWPEVTPGVAISLDPTMLDATANDDPAAWCAATTEYGLMQLGTPTAPNDPC